MTDIKWIPLTEYSNKYRVSISTLRRRIRTDRAEVNYVDGKYLLRDAPLADHQPYRQRVSKNEVAPPRPSLPLNFEWEQDHKIVQQPPTQPVSPPPKTEPVENTPKQSSEGEVNHYVYLNEIKKAYSLILQEKEEQVLILKDEIADLQTLVKVLESENERLRLAALSRQNPKAKSFNIEDMIEDSGWTKELEIE